MRKCIFLYTKVLAHPARSTRSGETIRAYARAVGSGKGVNFFLILTLTKVDTVGGWTRLPGTGFLHIDEASGLKVQIARDNFIGLSVSFATLRFTIEFLLGFFSYYMRI